MNPIRLITAVLHVTASVVMAVNRARAHARARAAGEPYTVGEVLGTVTAATKDFLNACELAGIPHEEAQGLIAGKIRADCAGTAYSVAATKRSPADVATKPAPADAAAYPLSPAYGTPGRNPYRD